ncbi:MAG: hypothetical protein WC635_08970 [Bacteriovorax sp.]|jgi:protein tyrosine phosphatase
MLALILQCLLLTDVHAGMVSNMPSTFAETGIPNSHLVTKNIVRGMAPRNSADIDTLINLGVTDFLIFKIDTNGDVAKEINLLEEKGISKTRISHFDFPWKDITDFQPICEMTIDALKKIEAVEKNNRKMFFHCTVGEDRTGFLAGLYKIYRENQSIDDVFKNELCDKGYEAGNPKKGMNVVVKIRESLTPSFLTMVEIINTARKNKIALSKKLCQQREFNSMNESDIKKFKCQKSKLIH